MLVVSSKIQKKWLPERAGSSRDIRATVNNLLWQQHENRLCAQGVE